MYIFRSCVSGYRNVHSGMSVVTRRIHFSSCRNNECYGRHGKRFQRRTVLHSFWGTFADSKSTRKANYRLVIHCYICRSQCTLQRELYLQCILRSMCMGRRIPEDCVGSGFVHIFCQHQTRLQMGLFCKRDCVLV